MILRFMLLTIIVMASIINFGLHPMVEASSPSHAFIALERGVTPHSINDAGICAGVWATKDMSLAVKLLPNGKIVKLAREQSAAYDIANNGTIVGQLGRAAQIWEADGTAVAPISYGYQSAATAINRAGTMVAGNMIMVSRTDSIPGNHAFRLIRRGKGDWSAGILGAGSVYAINDNGRAVGQTDQSSPQIFGYPSLDNPGAYLGVNNDGTVVGHVERRPVIVWPDQIVSTITNMPGVYRDINDAGDVVGEEEGVPVVRYAGGSTVPLSSLVSPKSLRGWQLLTARSINNVGDIVGTGAYRGKPRSYVIRNRIRLASN